MKSGGKKRVFVKQPQTTYWAIAIFLLSLTIYLALVDDLNIYEGKIAVLYYIAQVILINVVGVFVWIFFVIGVIKDKKTLGRSFFMSGFYIVLISMFFAFFISKNSIYGYHILFDKNIIVKTKNYNVAKEVIETNVGRGLNDGVYYYIVFDNNIILRINKDTYHYFENKIDYEIIITYKPKAQILYDLQILPK